MCEGTWTQPATPLRIPLMIYGSEGAIAVPRGSELLLPKRLATAGPPPEPETVQAPDLAPHYASGAAYFTHCLLHDQPFQGIVSGELSRDAQEILQAGLLSMESGSEVSLPLPSFLR